MKHEIDNVTIAKIINVTNKESTRHNLDYSYHKLLGSLLLCGTNPDADAKYFWEYFKVTPNNKEGLTLKGKTTGEIFQSKLIEIDANLTYNKWRQMHLKDKNGDRTLTPIQGEILLCCSAYVREKCLIKHIAGYVLHYHSKDIVLNFIKGKEDDVKQLVKEATGSEIHFDADVLLNQDTIENPYKGLDHFSVDDRDLFFGRDKEIDDIVGRISKAPFTAIMGSSGSGKSSLIFAGILPTICATKEWYYIYFRPCSNIRNDPFFSLASALLKAFDNNTSKEEKTRSICRLAEDLESGKIPLSAHLDVIREKNNNKKILLILDQFEELFSNKVSHEHKINFINLVHNTFSSRSSSFEEICASCVITLRYDYKSEAENHPQFIELLKSNEYIIYSISDEVALSELIQKPASKFDVSIEPHLLKELLKDFELSDRSLPLLQYSLFNLFKHRDGSVIKLSNYLDNGRILGSIDKDFDDYLKNLANIQEQDLVHSIFTKLVNFGEDSSKDTKKSVPIIYFNTNERNIIGELSGPIGNKNLRLLIIDQENIEDGEIIVEIIHEELLRKCKQLKAWLDEDREFELWRIRLNQFMRDWEKDKQQHRSLLKGVFLDEAIEKEKKYGNQFNESEKNYIGKSKNNLNYIRICIVAGIGVGIIILSTLLTSAYTSWKKNLQLEAKNEITYRQLFAKKSKEQLELGNNRLALLLANKVLHDHNFEHSSDSHNVALNVLRSLEDKYIKKDYIQIDHEVEWHITTSDHEFLVTSSPEGKIHVWNIQSKSKVQTIDARAKLSSLRLNKQNDKIVATTTSGTILIWNMLSGDKIFSYRRNFINFFDAILAEDERYIIAFLSHGFKVNKKMMVIIDAGDKFNSKKILSKTKTTAPQFIPPKNSYPKKIKNPFDLSDYIYREDSPANVFHKISDKEVLDDNWLHFAITPPKFNVFVEKNSLVVRNGIDVTIFHVKTNIPLRKTIAPYARMINSNYDVSFVDGNNIYQSYIRFSPHSTYRFPAIDFRSVRISPDNSLIANYETSPINGHIFIRIFDLNTDQGKVNIYCREGRPEGDFGNSGKLFLSYCADQENSDQLLLTIWDLKTGKPSYEAIIKKHYDFLSLSDDDSSIIGINKGYIDDKRLANGMTLLGYYYYKVFHHKINWAGTTEKNDVFNAYTLSQLKNKKDLRPLLDDVFFNPLNYYFYIMEDDQRRKDEWLRTISGLIITPSREDYEYNRSQIDNFENVEVAIYSEDDFMKKVFQTKISKYDFVSMMFDWDENSGHQTLSSDGNYWLYSDELNVYLASMYQGKVIAEFSQSHPNRFVYQFSPDNKMFLIASEDKATIYDVKTKNVLQTIEVGPTSKYAQPRFTYNSKNITWINSSGEQIIYPLAQEPRKQNIINYANNLKIRPLSEEELNNLIPVSQLESVTP